MDTTNTFLTLSIFLLSIIICGSFVYFDFRERNKWKKELHFLYFKKLGSENMKKEYGELTYTTNNKIYRISDFQKLCEQFEKMKVCGNCKFSSIECSHQEPHFFKLKCSKLLTKIGENEYKIDCYSNACCDNWEMKE